MKRFLSIVLALTMLISFIPSAFAEKTETAADIRVFYDISGDMTELGLVTGSGKSLAEIDYEHTSGFYSFFANTDSVNKQLYGYESNGYYCSFRSGVGGGSILLDRSYVAFEIYVPKAGTYDMQMYCPTNRWGAPVDVYLKKGEATTEAEYKVGQYSSDDNSIQDTQQFNIITTPVVVEDIQIPEAGNYVITFHETSGDYGYVGSFALTSGNGSTVPMDASVGLVSQQKAAAELLMSDRSIVPATSVEGVEVSYTSSNTDVATVDAATGAITPVVKGETEILATVTASDFTKTVKTVYNAPDMTPSVSRVTFMFNYYAPRTPGYSFTSDTTDPATVTYADTNGYWRWIEGPSGMKFHDNLGLWKGMTAGQYVAVGIYIPAAGRYNINYQYGTRSVANSPSTDSSLWILPASAERNIAEAMSETLPVIAGIDHTGTGSTGNSLVGGFGYTFPEAGEYIAVVKANVGGAVGIRYLSFEGVGGSDSVYGSVKLDKAELEIGETAAATSSLYRSLMASGTKFTKFESGIVFTSSNEKVATVAEDGTVTAVGAGKATISAEVPGYLTGHVIGTDITVNAAEAPETVSFAALANIAGVTIEGTGSVIDGTVARGTEITLTAPEVEGYKFIGWKRGSAATGKFIADAPQKDFEYTALSNGCLTAMYDEVNPAETAVEFWNGNGEHLETVAVVDGALEKEVDEPSLIGFEFDDWYVNDSEIFDVTNVLSGIVRAVARYNDKAQTFTVNGEGSYSYDSAVDFTSETEGAWKRNGNVVAYGDSYTYYVWDSANVEFVSGVSEKAPVVILEYSAKHGAYMIEYDKGSALEIAEAGILFGNGTPTVSGGAMEKFTSQRSVSHGQFTAKPENLSYNAVGYIVYKDVDNTYKVIYNTID
ncbi:MAG: Ig-like domain-containing protein [Oscillospiraceae bacterium]|nr:Ig-like domain-containing protein [Oscillospiraceae bacterium]MBQ7120324.1 Ig-like domain-containing protein [Oscillospiraceae bacterium]